MNLLLFIVAFFPDTVVAAYGIGTRVFSVVFLPAIAVARGVETMTGQNIGADKPDRAEQATALAAKALSVSSRVREFSSGSVRHLSPTCSRRIPKWSKSPRSFCDTSR